MTEAIYRLKEYPKKYNDSGPLLAHIPLLPYSAIYPKWLLSYTVAYEKIHKTNPIHCYSYHAFKSDLTASANDRSYFYRKAVNRKHECRR